MSDENQALEPVNSFFGAMGERTVDKIANVLGMLFPYAGVKKLAVDTYIDSIKSSNLSPDEKFIAISGARQHLNNLNNQLAIADIARSAATSGTDFSSESNVDDEWLSRFMDASKFVTDENAQLLWGNILAGEFERPGSTPPSVTRILTELTTEYAQIFSNLCSLEAAVIPETVDGVLADDMEERYFFIPQNAQADHLKELDITFYTLSELELLGLIKCGVNGYQSDSFSPEVYPRIYINYNSTSLVISRYHKEGLITGHVLLTAAGECISRFVNRINVSDHIESIKAFLSSNGCKVDYPT